MEPDQKDPTLAPAPQSEVAPSSVPTDQPQAPEYNDAPAANGVEDEVIEWEASEFVHHEKDIFWFVGLIAAGLVLGAVSVVLEAWTFTALVVVMVGSIIFLSVRPPRVLHYVLGGHGLEIDTKHYTFHDFKAFGVVQDGPFYYVSLLPVKRFMPSIDVYFPTEFGEEIVDMFGEHVPMQTIKPDFVDNLSKKLRF